MACNAGSMSASATAAAPGVTDPIVRAAAPKAGCHGKKTPWYVWVALVLILLIWLDVR